MAVRKVMRFPQVHEATGLSKPTVYRKMAEGKFPASAKLDPGGRAVVWFEDEVEAFQKGEWKAAEAVA